MKNLANCKPTEFIKQTNKIRKSVEKWLKDTDMLNIRKRMPELPENVTEEEKQKLTVEQAKKNISAILDAMLEDYPEETLEVLAYMCFVEPENIDDHTMSEYLGNFNELINDTAVISFFTSLARLGLTRI